MTNANSASALAGERANGRMSRRAQLILECARVEAISMRENYSPGMTDRECARRLGFVDMNAVRPRVTELIEMGLLKVVCNIPCPVTGKRVRFWRAASTFEVAEFQRRLDTSAPPRQLTLI